MCGIAGSVSTSDPRQPDDLDRALKSIAHRGPDDQGEWHHKNSQVVLGCRRLAIIDLSDQSNQPISNEDGSIQLVFNGEIYNYQTLRKELIGNGHQFRSEGDTEVLVHAYEEWGTGFLNRLRGQFAIGLWDDRRQRLLLARDRIGIKPLFYHHTKQTLAFASELKAIKQLAGSRLTLNETAIFDYLNTGLFIPTPKSIYNEVKKLEPGHFLIFEAGRITIERYWELNFEPADRSASEIEETFLSLFREAVEMRLVSDVPLGVLLSGGLDSSSITMLAAQALDHPLQSFSVGFDIEEHSETQFAELVALKAGTQHTNEILSRGDIRDSLTELLGAYDEPFSDSSALPTLLVSKMASRYVKVALSGDGGDEALLGYLWYDRWLQRAPFKVPAALRGTLSSHQYGRSGHRFDRMMAYLSASPLRRISLARGGFTTAEIESLLSDRMKDQYRAYDSEWFLRAHWREDLPTKSALQYLDIHTYLPDDMLTKVDRASMAYSLEIRTPLLDHKFLEFVGSIPTSSLYRRDQVEKKPLLRKVMQPFLPEKILKRGKKGFSAPTDQWKFDQKGQIDDSLFTGALVDSNLFGSGLENTLQRNPLAGNKYWNLLILDHWFAREGITSS